MILHAIGDSHCRLFWHLTDRARVHWLGPMTAHRVGRDGLPGLRAAQEWLDVRGQLATRDWVATVEPGSVVAWCFGEIDVRCHLAGRVSESGGAVLVDLVGRYLETVASFSDATGALPAIVSVTPAVDSRNPAFPCRGSLAERRRITGMLNTELARRCPEFGAAFVALAPFVADEAGGIRSGLTGDGLHLGPAAAPIAQRAIETALGGLHAA